MKLLSALFVALFAISAISAAPIEPSNTDYATALQCMRRDVLAILYNDNLGSYLDRFENILDSAEQQIEQCKTQSDTNDCVVAALAQGQKDGDALIIELYTEDPAVAAEVVSAITTCVRAGNFVNSIRTMKAVPIVSSKTTYDTASDIRCIRSAVVAARENNDDEQLNGYFETLENIIDDTENEFERCQGQDNQKECVAAATGQARAQGVAVIAELAVKHPVIAASITRSISSCVYASQFTDSIKSIKTTSNKLSKTNYDTATNIRCIRSAVVTARQNNDDEQLDGYFDTLENIIDDTENEVERCQGQDNQKECVAAATRRAHDQGEAVVAELAVKHPVVAANITRGISSCVYARYF